VDINSIKRAVVEDVDGRRPQLQELALKIHANPELGFKEIKASEWITKYLDTNGFSIDRGICELPTAFRASYGQGKPAIAILAEYDALAGVGHACGHNLICTIAAGAAIASRQVVDRYGGTIVVIGTPAEEGEAGKAVMAGRGAFNDIDAAMIVHPGNYDMATFYAMACQTLDIEFFGKASHAASAPEAGINALEAMILSFNAIDSLRQHISTSERVHGIITDGGQAANVVPEHSAGNFIIRAANDTNLDKIKKRVMDCFKGAATATGARLEYRWADYYYSAMQNNIALANLYVENTRSIGRQIIFADPHRPSGSTDMGNVSQLVPSIHPFVAIAPRDVALHTAEFAGAAASESGIDGMCDAVKATAMTVVDLLAVPDNLTRVKEEFKQGNG